MDAATDTQAARNKLVILKKLELHYFKPDLTEAQQKQRWSDYLTDLAPFSVYQVERACAVWRQSPATHFPTSGQLIEKMHEMHDASIAKARANSPLHRAIEDGAERKFPKELKPWRDILRDARRLIPPGNSPIAKALDALQPLV